MKRWKLAAVALAGILTLGLTAHQAHASGSTVELGTDIPKAPKERIWTVGLGAAAVPDYEGSEDYKVAPIPLVNVIDPSGWFVLLVGNTLRANLLPGGTWRLGPMARYRVKRDDVDNSKVDKMESVDAAVEVGGFVGFQHAGWSLQVDAVTDVASGHEGSLVEVTGGYTWQPERWRIKLSGSTTWASDDYMSAYFGVDSQDSKRSGLDKYDAEAGFKDVGAMLVTSYRFTQHWGVTGAFSVTRLIGDAADSPLVEDEGDENQILLGGLVSYTF
jgi:outer membrane scaffolding protein for murein synthesis (MipA/OmpV family)